MLGEVNKGHRENTQQKESLTKAEMKVLTMEGSGHRGQVCPEARAGRCPQGTYCASKEGRGNCTHFFFLKSPAFGMKRCTKESLLSAPAHLLFAARTSLCHLDH